MYFNVLSKGEFRNQPCICNSGKKTKKFHGSKSLLTIKELNELREVAENYNKRLAFQANCPKIDLTNTAQE